MQDNDKIWRYVVRKQKNDRVFEKRLKSKYLTTNLSFLLGYSRR